MGAPFDGNSCIQARRDGHSVLYGGHVMPPITALIGLMLFGLARSIGSCADMGDGALT